MLLCHTLHLCPTLAQRTFIFAPINHLRNASVSEGLLAHSLETKPVKQPVEVQTQVVYRDSVIVKDNVIVQTVEVEKPLTGWQSFKMAMGGWMLGLIIFMIVCVILYIVKPFNKL